MISTIEIAIDGTPFRVEPGISVAAAIARCANGIGITRISVTGHSRAPVCGMGICQECRVTINGHAHQLACQTLCMHGMQVLTGTLA